jgi:hypothetical protein
VGESARCTVKGLDNRHCIVTHSSGRKAPAVRLARLGVARNNERPTVSRNADPQAYTDVETPLCQRSCRLISAG